MGRDQLYNFEKPVGRPPALVKGSAALGSTALTDSANFDPLWTKRSVAFGAPPEKVQHTNVSFAEAIMANDKWEGITTKYYTETLEKLWKEKQYELGGYEQVDVVGDVLNAAHMGFITSVLGIPLTKPGTDAKHESHGLLSVFGEVFEHAFGDPNPSSLSTKIRGVTHWLVSNIEESFNGTSTSKSKQGELGQSAFAKLSESGNSSAEATWQKILPTSALLLNTLSRLSTQTVEFFLDDKAALAEAQGAAGKSSDKPSAALETVAKEATRLTSKVTLATKASSQVSAEKGVGAEQGQIVVVNLANAQGEDTKDAQKFNLKRDESAYDMKAYGPEVELAYKVTYICNTALTGIMGRQPGIDRVPGPQGKLKKIHDDAGNVMYMNAEESEFVPYPVSMKVRWKA